MVKSNILEDGRKSPYILAIDQRINDAFEMLKKIRGLNINHENYAFLHKEIRLELDIASKDLRKVSTIPDDIRDTLEANYKKVSSLHNELVLPISSK